MENTAGGRRPFDPLQQTNPQRPIKDIEVDPSSIPPGGKIIQADVPPQRAGTAGTVAGPSNRKPFSIKGGG